MNLTRLLPGPAEEFDLDSPTAADDLDRLYSHPARQWLRLNMIASVNGNAAGPDGTSDGLSSRVDRRILGSIRRCADIVLVGAASVRAEGYILPKAAPLAVVTATGNLGGHRFPQDLAAGRLIILCPTSAVEAVNRSLEGRAVEVVTLPGERLTPVDIMGALRERGFAGVVCEGGPQLAAQLVDADLVDELCLSVSPVLTGLDLPVFGTGLGRRRLELSQLLADSASGLYSRWTLAR